MPFYSTAVGLLVGASEYAAKQVVEAKLFEMPPVAEQPQKEEVRRTVRTKTTKPKSEKEPTLYTGDLFVAIKNRIAGIFDEKDVEM
jgi:hypothetical protein